MTKHMMDVLVEFADTHDGTLEVGRLDSEHGNEWVISMVWGHEAPDSPMAGAASYGSGETFAAAALEVLREIANEKVVCRARVSKWCYHGKAVENIYGESCGDNEWPGMDLDGTFKDGSVVCDACYELVIPESPSGAALHDELDDAIAKMKAANRGN